MSKNYISLEIGGKQRGLKFNMGTFRVIGEVTGEDPFSFKAKSAQFGDFMEYVSTVAYAALVSNCRQKKEEPDFSFDDVKGWCEDLRQDDILLITGGLMGDTQAAEVGADTQSVTDVAAGS